jgi:NADH-quinone oxidoreductase subunit L
MADALVPHLPSLLWLVPLLPLLAGAIIAFLPNRMGKLASRLALAALFVSCVIALAAFVCTLTPAHHGEVFRMATSVTWFSFGEVAMKVGLVLDPLASGMGAMVTFVAFWIFLYSTGYMEKEARFGRFFGFLSLFSGAMLMVVYANSLLLLFMAWELVGLASYLLIGFYFEKPSAAAAAQKAFITTRVGDMAFFLGMIWLYGQTDTLLFYDNGNGLLESGALASLAGVTTIGGLTVSAMAALLLLVGAMGKSGQVPLHTWLPDAMEGPTPVSALIHAATMVAAGVYLVARTHPIFMNSGATGLPLSATAWIGGITALYAACVALGQNDIKRILAYSTVSQLGFMMVALGTGGVEAAMFHLIAHAFFKALLFLSAGSVIHGCHDEQDIRKMGGLRHAMPKTFVTYAIGMMALAGFPFVFSGFWSKEAVLHSAEIWPGGHGPFLLAVCAALLTAFYMTRQALLVFFDKPREPGVHHPHESPPVMLIPLYVLATGAVLLAVVGTPLWPWFEEWLLKGEQAVFDGGALFKPEAIKLVILSLALVTVGVTASWLVYRNPSSDSRTPDPLEGKLGKGWTFLGQGMYFDAMYDKFIIANVARLGGLVDRIERGFFVPLMVLTEGFIKLFGRWTGTADEKGLNAGFNRVCGGLQDSAESASDGQSGRPQSYLRAIGLGTAALLLVYFWITA